MAVVTISRQVGSAGEEIANRVCELLGYQYFDKTLMTRVAAEVGLSEREVIDFSEDDYRVKGFLQRMFGSRVAARVTTRTRDARGAETLTVEQLNEAECVSLVRSTVLAAHKQGDVVIVGRGGQAILQDMPDVFHVRIEAPMEARIRRMQEQEAYSADEAQQRLVRRDQASAEYLRQFFGIRWDDATLYHLVINTGKWEPEAAAQLIVNALG
jgi:cytidylate kinase